jgi:hypothetical protein
MGNRLILNQLRLMCRLIYDFCAQVEILFTDELAFKKCNPLFFFSYVMRELFFYFPQKRKQYTTFFVFLFTTKFSDCFLS